MQSGQARAYRCTNSEEEEKEEEEAMLAVSSLIGGEERQGDVRHIYTHLIPLAG